MFDIIELNDTTSDDSKIAKEIIMETPQLENEASKSPTIKSNTEHNENLYTTVVYQKEPPSETNYVTNKSVKKSDKPKKQMMKEKDPKKLIHQQIFNKSATNPPNLNNLEAMKQSEKILSKEVEMFPINTDPLTKLNRTFRKEIPVKEENTDKTKLESPSPDKHQHVEIKWHEEGTTNTLPKQIFITTKRTSTKQNLELFNSSEEDPLPKIDSKLDLLNSNITVNNDSEIFVQPEKISESLLGETNTPEPLEPEPEAQPRPNRQRQLTRPQRRSFYPYFFSRVLG